MGHISVNWSWSRKKRRLGALIIGLAKIHPNGFKIEGNLSQIEWVMNNVNGAFFKLDRYDPRYPKGLLFIAPDELALARLVKARQ